MAATHVNATSRHSTPATRIERSCRRWTQSRRCRWMPPRCSEATGRDQGPGTRDQGQAERTGPEIGTRDQGPGTRVRPRERDQRSRPEIAGPQNKKGGPWPPSFVLLLRTLRFPSSGPFESFAFLRILPYLLLNLFLRHQVPALRLEPREQMTHFPEAAVVRVGAENDDGDGVALREAQKRGEAVARLGNESGLRAKDVHVSIAHEVIRAVDRNHPAAGRDAVIRGAHDRPDPLVARGERDQVREVERRRHVVRVQPGRIREARVLEP